MQGVRLGQFYWAKRLLCIYVTTDLIQIQSQSSVFIVINKETFVCQQHTNNVCEMWKN